MHWEIEIFFHANSKKLKKMGTCTQAKKVKKKLNKFGNTKKRLLFTSIESV